MPKGLLHSSHPNTLRFPVLSNGSSHIFFKRVSSFLTSQDSTENNSAYYLFLRVMVYVVKLNFCFRFLSFFNAALTLKLTRPRFLQAIVNTASRLDYLLVKNSASQSKSSSSLLLRIGLLDGQKNILHNFCELELLTCALSIILALITLEPVELVDVVVAFKLTVLLDGFAVRAKVRSTKVTKLVTNHGGNVLGLFRTGKLDVHLKTKQKQLARNDNNRSYILCSLASPPPHPHTHTPEMGGGNWPHTQTLFERLQVFLVCLSKSRQTL